MSASTSQLFQPTTIGSLTLQHRIVMAPLSRSRARKLSHVPVVPLVKEYYSQRSRTPGTFIIAEGTNIAHKAITSINAPGIWSQDQINAWKEIVDVIHANGSFTYLQLWAAGRGADPSSLEAEGITMVAPSPIPLSYQQTPIPHELTVDEIQEYIQLFVQAAKAAVYEVGFDGVEVHALNGYLLDQFLQDMSNKRTDNYGGSIENRSRFPLEVVDAVAQAVGPERVAVRVSPWSPFQDMKMDDPVPQFTHFISALKSSHPSLAYLHVVEPRISGGDTVDEVAKESNDFIRRIWSPKTLISAGGYSRDSAMKQADETGELIAFGRNYISNPDLPLRLMKDIPLNAYDRATFVVSGDLDVAGEGYIDYPFSELSNSARCVNFAG